MKLLHPAHLRQTVEGHGSAMLANFIRAPAKSENVSGYLVEISSEWLVIRELNWDCFRLNGVCLIPVSTVTRVQVFEEMDWPNIAAQKFRLAGSPRTKISTRSFQELIEAYRGNTSIIELEEAWNCKDQIYLGQITRFTKIHIHVKSYDRDLKPSQVRFALADITKLNLRHGYALAIESALRKRREARRTK